MKGQGPDTNLIIDHMGNLKMVPSDAKENKPGFLPI
jgi:predicted TIM-barrel fold metal-dependent hydrolase